jgi:ribosome biogenesis GTPase / thiamine phosphate phosphatase
VTAVYGKHIRVYSEGVEYEAQIKGRMLKEALGESPVAVGDNVEFEFDSDRQAHIEKVMPRGRILARQDVYVKGRRQIIATNLDQLMIITSTTEPAFKPGLVDRFLISAEKNDLNPLIVLNKIDLKSAADFAGITDSWKKLGYPVIEISARKKDGLETLAEVLANKTSAFTGHSGVGKSTIINSLAPESAIKTSEISLSTGKGIHTTTGVRMFPIGGNGWIIDTPGLKVFDIQEIRPDKLYQFFPEINELEGHCRFGNCSHLKEPGCAVKQAVADQKIAAFRYQSFEKFFEELSKPKTTDR